MPKKKRIIFRENEMEDIIHKSVCCYIGMVDENNIPYVLPFNFGYKNKCIYLHSGNTGKKINILKRNPNVCIVFSIGHDLSCQNKDVACSYIMSYKSAICYGKVEFIDEIEQKIEAMNVIMKHYTGKVFTYSKPAIENVLIYKVPVDEITAKEFGNLS